MPVPVVSKNHSVGNQTYIGEVQIVLCPQCIGHGRVVVEITAGSISVKQEELCAYCRGERVVESRIHHQYCIGADK